MLYNPERKATPSLTNVDIYRKKTHKIRKCNNINQCYKSRKATGSIADGVSGIFRWPNPSSRTMPQRSTQPLTEMSTRDISLGVKAAGA